MTVEEIWSVVENALESEELTMEDVQHQDVELSVGEGQMEGILDHIEAEFIKTQQIIKLTVGIN